MLMTEEKLVAPGEISNTRRRELPIRNADQGPIEGANLRGAQTDAFDAALNSPCLAVVTDLDGFISNDHYRAEEVLDRLLGGERKRDSANAESGNDGRKLEAHTAQDQE